MLAVKLKARARGARCCAPKYRPGIDGAQASHIAEQLRALADPTRLRMLSMLARHGGEVCVCDLVETFDLGQPTISHHLGVLRAAGLVSALRRGIWAYYAVDRTAWKQMRSVMDEVM